MPAEETKKIVAIFDAPEETPEQYAQLLRSLDAAGAGNPKGRLYHVGCSKGDGYLVVDVWESAELLNQFAETLAPTIQKLGGTPAEPRIYPVLDIIKG